MKVQITYVTGKTKMVRSKLFIRENVQLALDYFSWRYGHKILNIKTG